MSCVLCVVCLALVAQAAEAATEVDNQEILQNPESWHTIFLLQHLVTSIRHITKGSLLRPSLSLLCEEKGLVGTAY